MIDLRYLPILSRLIIANIALIKIMRNLHQKTSNIRIIHFKFRTRLKIRPRNKNLKKNK